MRTTILLALVCAVVLTTGCAGPERKLGRGIMNVTELLRGGEIRRSMEQTYLWENTDAAYTTGFIRGMNRSLARTAIGVYEIATFPLPGYGPMFTSTNRIYPDQNMRNASYPFGGMQLTEYPTYPDNYKPGVRSDSIFATDTARASAAAMWPRASPAAGSRFSTTEVQPFPMRQSPDGVGAFFFSRT